MAAPRRTPFLAVQIIFRGMHLFNKNRIDYLQIITFRKRNSFRKRS